jgi:hypothetical protein
MGVGFDRVSGLKPLIWELGANSLKGQMLGMEGKLRRAQNTVETAE